MNGVNKQKIHVLLRAPIKMPAMIFIYIFLYLLSFLLGFGTLGFQFAQIFLSLLLYLIDFFDQSLFIPRFKNDSGHFANPETHSSKFRHIFIVHFANFIISSKVVNTIPIVNFSLSNIRRNPKPFK